MFGGEHNFWHMYQMSSGDTGRGVCELQEWSCRATITASSPVSRPCRVAASITHKFLPKQGSIICKHVCG